MLILDLMNLIYRGLRLKWLMRKCRGRCLRLLGLKIRLRKSELWTLNLNMES